MKFYLFTTLLLALSVLAGHAQTVSNPDLLPYTMSLQEVTQDELPGLHSFALGKWDKWWVVIGGRVNGLHGFFINTGFPDDKANKMIRLMNPETGDLHEYPLESLNILNRDALKATNPQYVQDGDILYICGGYGKDGAQNKMLTFPVLTAVNLPLLVNSILENKNPTAAFVQKEVASLRVCGGEMDKIGDWFYLVGGHDFAGLYNQNGPPQFVQQYTNEIRKFKISLNGSALSVLEYSAYRDEANLHRRDFTMAPLIRPDGQEALGLYGGVFRVGADLPFYNPVYIANDVLFKMDASYNQLFSQYTCPTIPMFDSTDGSMYTLFFGGLSVHTYNKNTRQLEYDEKVPFVKDITTFHRKANGTSAEYVMPERFDAFLGTNMVFVLNKNVPHYKNEVIKLRELTGPTVVGTLFGGIKAEIPNLTPSSANNRMFQVTITPARSVQAGSPASTAPVRIVPTQISSDTRPLVQNLDQGTFVAIVNTMGQIVAQGPFQPDSFANQAAALPAGSYWLKTPDKAVFFVKL
jgi:hypothetical protein